MQILKMFTIYDSKAEAYLRPFFCPTKGIALRSISDAVNTPGDNLQKHAADYTLFEIGEYDDSTGNITMHASKINLGVCHEFLNTNNPVPAFNYQNDQSIDPKKKKTTNLQGAPLGNTQ